MKLTTLPLHSHKNAGVHLPLSSDPLTGLDNPSDSCQITFLVCYADTLLPKLGVKHDFVHKQTACCCTWREPIQQTPNSFPAWITAASPRNQSYNLGRMLNQPKSWLRLQDFKALSVKRWKTCSSQYWLPGKISAHQAVSFIMLESWRRMSLLGLASSKYRFS